MPVILEYYRNNMRFEKAEIDIQRELIIIWAPDAGWSSLVARRAHNPKVGGSNPPPATNKIKGLRQMRCNPFLFSGTSFIRVL